MKKDKQKVIGEDLSDSRLKILLDLQPPKGRNRDHHILTRAYRSLRADDFARFMPFFVDAGFNVNALDNDGQTVLATISGHNHAPAYINTLKKAGAV